MSHFWKEHSYDIVKMFLYQIAIAIFGISLALATGSKSTSVDTTGQQPATLQIVTSIFSIAFYLFLICHSMWELGAKDSARIARGEPGGSRLTGLYMGLTASSVNFLIAVCITLGTFLSDIPFFSNVGAGAATLGLLIEGMYTGLLAIRVGDIPLNSMWFMWFIIMIPMIVAAALSYFAGTHNFCLFKPNSPQNK